MKAHDWAGGTCANCALQRRRKNDGWQYLVGGKWLTLSAIPLCDDARDPGFFVDLEKMAKPAPRTDSNPDAAYLDCDDMAAAYDAMKEPTTSPLKARLSSEE